MTEVFYFGQAQTVGLTVFGIAAGVIMRYTHRYKVCASLSSAFRGYLLWPLATPRHRSVHPHRVSPVQTF